MSNFPQPIYGIKRMEVNARILGRIGYLGALATAKGGKVARDFPGDQSLAGMARATKTLMQMIKQKKYVSFRDKVFFEIYAPRFPSKTADRMLEATVLNLTEDPTGKSGFFSNVDLAITARCMFRCEHCYAADALAKKDVVSVEQWKSVIDSFRRFGVGVFSFVGGEPLLRFDDMVELCRYASTESDVWTVTAGWGLTPQRAEVLAEAGLVGAAVSLDHYEPDKHNAFRRNKKAWDAAINAVEMFANAGILPALAICSTRDVLESDGLYRYLELAKELKVGFIQIVEPIRSGEYLADHDAALSEAELRQVQAFQRDINHNPRWAEYPSVVSRSSTEDSDLGVGCGAGGNTFIYVDPKGHLQPCPLLNVTSGNVFEVGFDVALDRMKELFPHPIANGCICPANALYHRLAEARERTGGKLPIPYEATKEICAEFAQAPLPPLYGGEIGARSVLSKQPSREEVERVAGEQLVKLRRSKEAAE